MKRIVVLLSVVLASTVGSCMGADTWFNAVAGQATRKNIRVWRTTGAMDLPNEDRAYVGRNVFGVIDASGQDMSVMAEAMGISVDEFIQMSAAGKQVMSADQVAQYLVNTLPRIIEQNDTDETIKGGLKTLSDSFYRAIAQYRENDRKAPVGNAAVFSFVKLNDDNATFITVGDSISVLSNNSRAQKVADGGSRSHDMPNQEFKERWIQIAHVPLTPDINFILLASDGIFKAITEQQAIDFVNQRITAHGGIHAITPANATQITRELVEHAFEASRTTAEEEYRRSATKEYYKADDATAVIVFLKPNAPVAAPAPHTPSPRPVSPRRPSPARAAHAGASTKQNLVNNLTELLALIPENPDINTFTPLDNLKVYLGEHNEALTEGEADSDLLHSVGRLIENLEQELNQHPAIRATIATALQQTKAAHAMAMGENPHAAAPGRRTPSPTRGVTGASAKELLLARLSMIVESLELFGYDRMAQTMRDYREMLARNRYDAVTLQGTEAGLNDLEERIQREVQEQPLREGIEELIVAARDILEIAKREV